MFPRKRVCACLLFFVVAASAPLRAQQGNGEDNAAAWTTADDHRHMLSLLGAARLALSDADGRQRLLLSVDAAGTAKIQFLDAAGSVVREIVP